MSLPPLPMRPQKGEFDHEEVYGDVPSIIVKDVTTGELHSEQAPRPAHTTLEVTALETIRANTLVNNRLCDLVEDLTTVIKLFKHRAETAPKKPKITIKKPVAKVKAKKRKR